MSPAKDMVLSTPELLDLLLTQLSMRDLLISAPLVSKKWQAITLGPAVQRALFFRPDPLSQPTKNPLLVEMFSPFFVAPTKGESPRGWPVKPADIKAMPWSKAPEVFKHPDASWRRMLVAQPPAQTLVMKSTQTSWGGHRQKSTGVLNDAALRMGDLYDVTLMYVNRVSSLVLIRWNNDVEAENDLTLEAFDAKQCVSGGPRPLGPEFYSDGAGFMELKARIIWDADV
ncbi:hypothetical protein DFH07DRAFT_834278 [Mycena maculata]|uniref:F-box domain-containing protein n=1 Tax=Mycena maculata TaxID=230809 RepID=A0AAD7IMF6_9AGAR|nr:hypothetical protein DFH07DRAFT_834278 [Mycena maculata]